MCGGIERPMFMSSSLRIVILLCILYILEISKNRTKKQEQNTTAAIRSTILLEITDAHIPTVSLFLSLPVSLSD